MCQGDRLPTVLEWSPYEETETSFQLAIGDVSTKETLVKINHLKWARIAPSSITISEMEKDGANARESQPKVVPAVWGE